MEGLYLTQVGWDDADLSMTRLNSVVECAAVVWNMRLVAHTAQAPRCPRFESGRRDLTS